MLISAVMPIMSIYRLPHGQYAYSGHVINLPQNVLSFATSLPRLPKELDVLVVKKLQGDSHRHFRVRRTVVEEAINWLIQNNLYYQRNQVSLNQHALAQLPEDGNLRDLRSITIESLNSVEQQNSDESTYEAQLSQSFVPNAARLATEQETVRQSIQHRHTGATTSTLMWPTIGGTPINEFNTEGYMSLAFPTLFPTGAADFLGRRCTQVTLGNYFKHLLMYEDGRFASHPRFRFFALNTEMRWRALQTGQIYVKQHPADAQMSVDELRQMVGAEGEIFSNRVLHYAASLRGTKQYWFRQRTRLISMVDTLGLPTIFFTHSAADLHWPELTQLTNPEYGYSRSNQNEALIENPATSDWFFYHRIEEFIKTFYVGILGATDYWLRFEWQHRGSPHVHGLAWLPNAPDVDQLVCPETSESVKQQAIQYANTLISTMSPGVSIDGSNINDAPSAKTDPHICAKPYSQVTDFSEDLKDLVATCQRHTRCSEAYCLRKSNGKQECRFGYPKPMQPHTTVLTSDQPTLLTARNDGLLNSYNLIQLSGWRANVDMQYIVSRQKVVDYCTKYVTKSEPRSQTLKDVFTKIVRGLKDGSRSLKAVQKLLINSVGNRDYSAQETCHLLLQLPMYKASREFVVLSLDGSRLVQHDLVQEDTATAPSILDHYAHRPITDAFDSMTLMEFTQNYIMPKDVNLPPKRRNKKVIVIARPYCSPDPEGPNYEQFCRQYLMQHKSFRQINELVDGFQNYTEAYDTFLQSSNIPQSLENDIFQQNSYEQQQQEQQVNYYHCGLYLPYKATYILLYILCTTSFLF